MPRDTKVLFELLMAALILGRPKECLQLPELRFYQNEVDLEASVAHRPNDHPLRRQRQVTSNRNTLSKAEQSGLSGSNTCLSYLCRYPTLAITKTQILYNPSKGL